MKRALFIFLSLLACMLSSCIDGEEEIFINDDGSASLKAVYSLPALILSDADAEELRKTVAKELGSDEKIRLVQNTVERSKGRQVITIELETDNLLDLEDLVPDEESGCLLYTSPSPRDLSTSRMPSSA